MKRFLDACGVISEVIYRLFPGSLSPYYRKATFTFLQISLPLQVYQLFLICFTPKLKEQLPILLKI